MFRTPYYVVIINTWESDDDRGYAEMGRRMTELGTAQPGYLGRTSVRGEAGHELTVFYYENPEAIAAWKQVPEHLGAQRLGRERWYSRYTVEVAKVERAYEFDAATPRS